MQLTTGTWLLRHSKSFWFVNLCLTEQDMYNHTMPSAMVMSLMTALTDVMVVVTATVACP